MYKRLYTFLDNKNIIYNLQFGFRQQYSTSHALINITENIRKALDDGNIGCGVFVDFQKAFDTVDHQILLAKLNHYGICGVSNDWFQSYLSNRHQHVSINGYEIKQQNLVKSITMQMILIHYVSVIQSKN